MTKNAYDGRGNILSVEDPLGHITTFDYDSRGQLVTETDAEQKVTAFEYEEFGNQTKVIDALGHETTSTYDPTGNLLTQTTTRTLSNGTTEILTSTFIVDELGRTVETVLPDGSSTTTTYDFLGEVIATRDPLELVPRTYDHVGRMKTVTDSRGGVYSYSYDAAGQRTSLSYPNGVVTSYAYDETGRLLTLRTESSSGLIQTYAYQLGPTGNRLAVTEWDGTVRSYQYDLLYRLTNERVEDGTGALVYQNSFGYDAVGNRLSQDRIAADGSVRPVVYSYDDRDRLLTESSMTGGGHRDLVYGWDANGNQISKVGTGANGQAVNTGYGWDFEHRLIEVSLDDGSVTTNSYDADGVWMRARTVGGADPGVTGWVVDTDSRSSVLGEVRADLASEFVRGAQQMGVAELLAASSATGNLGLHLDSIGSLRAVSDDDGAIDSVYQYEAFGTLLTETGAAELPAGFSFTGNQLAHELLYLRARWASPLTGRFLSMDENEGFSGNPSSLHRFAYVLSDPVNATDHSGLRIPVLV